MLGCASQAQGMYWLSPSFSFPLLTQLLSACVISAQFVEIKGEWQLKEVVW
jgi:hypothetical protein